MKNIYFATWIVILGHLGAEILKKIQLDAAILKIKYGRHNGRQKFGSQQNSKLLGHTKV